MCERLFWVGVEFLLLFLPKLAGGTNSCRDEGRDMGMCADVKD